MKFNFRVPLIDLNGKPIMDGTKEVKLLDVCQIALTTSHQDEQALPAADKIMRFALGLKITEPVPQELTIEEVAEIRKLVAKTYGPLVVGRAYEILDDKKPDKQGV